jgi:hypothetical protein
VSSQCVCVVCARSRARLLACSPSLMRSLRPLSSPASVAASPRARADGVTCHRHMLPSPPPVLECLDGAQHLLQV